MYTHKEKHTHTHTPFNGATVKKIKAEIAF